MHLPEPTAAGCADRRRTKLESEAPAPDALQLNFTRGTRLLGYDLTTPPRRLWADTAEVGFWRWARHGDVVLMSAELELAAWDLDGRKLWTTFVEPPWEYAVRDGVVALDVMGAKSEFSARAGPGQPRATVT